jgi:hypothetical protein
MASSELISGWGNGGWGQTPWGKDLLLVSVDGNVAASAVGLIDVRAGAVTSVLGQALPIELGTVVIDLSSLVPVLGVGAQVILGNLAPVVWSAVDDVQGAVWQNITEPQNTWSNIESAPPPSWAEVVR